MTQDHAHKVAWEAFKDEQNTEDIPGKIADALLAEFAKELQQYVAIPDQKSWPVDAIELVLAFHAFHGKTDVIFTIKREGATGSVLDLSEFGASLDDHGMVVPMSGVQVFMAKLKELSEAGHSKILLTHKEIG